MKKIILSTAVFLFAFSTTTIHAKEILNNPNSTEIIVNYNINSFCKLIQMGDYDAVAALIKSGEDVNRKSNGLTPLMFAARHNKAKIAKLLIESGAKLKTRSERGKVTALELAKRSKAKEAYKVIKKAMEK